MKHTVRQWFDQSRYDLGTAKAMHLTGRYLYVAFMCQQAIEKYLKALICEKTDRMPPYLHNLTTLSEHLGLKPDDEQRDFLELLGNYYINTRYPVIKQKLTKSLNRKECTRLLRQTKDFLQWLKKR